MDDNALTAEEVISRVRWIEEDQLLRDMRDRARRRHELHSMLTVPDLPPHLTRGDAVSVNSPDVVWLTNSILADCRSYPTTTSVIPQGKYNKDQQDEGDEVEKWYAVKRAQLDDGGRNSHDITWHQCVTGYAVMILHCGAAGDPDPWRVEVPDPLTCFFPVEGGPMRPSFMARRYTMLVGQVQDRYNSQKRTKFADKTLNFTEEEWKWATPLGEDEPVETGDVGNLTTSRIGLPGVADVVEMMELYLQGHIYHVALHGTISTGQGVDGKEFVTRGKDSRFEGTNGCIVWEADTMTDGIPVVIVPGHVTPLRVPVERFQPILWPAMQCALVINMIRAIRMTKAFNWRPDVIVEQTPELIAALKEAGVLLEPTNVQIEQAGPNIINVGGKAYFWNQPTDDDLDKLETSWTNQMARIMDSQLIVTTAEVTKQATMGGMQISVGVRKRQQGPMLANKDWGWSEILKMVRASILVYKDNFPVYSEGGERFKKGKLESNTAVEITPKMIDFPHKIVVSTQSMTEEERRMLIQDWAYRQTMGLSTQVEGLEAADYQDIADQVEKLAIDLALKHTTSGWAQQLDAVCSDYIRTSGGILISFGQPPTQPLPPGQGGNPGQLQGQTSRQIPPTGSVAGGSAGAQQGP